MNAFTGYANGYYGTHLDAILFTISTHIIDCVADQKAPSERQDAKEIELLFPGGDEARPDHPEATNGNEA